MGPSGPGSREASGVVDSLWQTDRLVGRAPFLECLSAAAALAGRTRRLKFGMNVLSLAFRDPVLRSEGLASDRFGDAVAFFQITEHEAHIVLCSCHGGEAMRAEEAARRVRGIRSPSLWSLYFGWFAH